MAHSFHLIRSEYAKNFKDAASEIINQALAMESRQLPEMYRKASIREQRPRRITMPAVMTAKQAAAISERVNAEAMESPSVRKILDAIHAAYPVSMSFDAAARRAGISSRSSAYRQYRKAIASSAELERDGDRYRSRPEFAKSGAGLSNGASVEQWAAKLPPTYGKMLLAIHSEGALTKDEVAAHAGVSPTSSGLGSGLRELKRLALIVEDGGSYSVAEGL
jgi:hypothetical protein